MSKKVSFWMSLVLFGAMMTSVVLGNYKPAMKVKPTTQPNRPATTQVVQYPLLTMPFDATLVYKRIDVLEAAIPESTQDIQRVENYLHNLSTRNERDDDKRIIEGRAAVANAYAVLDVFKNELKALRTRYDKWATDLPSDEVICAMRGKTLKDMESLLGTKISPYLTTTDIISYDITTPKTRIMFKVDTNTKLITSVQVQSRAVNMIGG